MSDRGLSVGVVLYEGPGSQLLSEEKGLGIIKALLQEGVECLLAGDIDTGKAVLRDYINAPSCSRICPLTPRSSCFEVLE